jgi:hypothetical protein
MNGHPQQMAHVGRRAHSAHNMRHRGALRQGHAQGLYQGGHHAMPHHAMPQRFHSLAEQQALYDESDDIARREAIATEEQNYQELSQSEKRHSARVEALREEEVEEDDVFESKHHKPAALHKKSAKHSKHAKKHQAHKQHHKPAHHAKKVAHHQQAQPVHHAHQVVTADQAADRGYLPEAPGKVSSEVFTKGKFDSSESLVQHKGHKKHHRHQALAHEQPPTKEEQEAAAEKEFNEEYAKSAQEQKIKDLEIKKKVLEQQYAERMAAAGQHDGLVPVGGKKIFVDDGTVVGGVNVLAAHHSHHTLAQQPHEKKATSEVE